MALSNVMFLMKRVEDILNASDIVLDPPTREIFEFAHKELQAAEEITKRVVWRSKSFLADEIAVGVLRLQDVIESHIFKLIVTQSEGRGEAVGIQFLEKEIRFFCNESLKKLLEFAPKELLYSSFPNDEEEEEGEEEEDEEEEPRSSSGHKSKMVGLLDQYNELKHMLMTDGVKGQLRVLSLVGMPGIGKTTLAQKVFEDPDSVEHFQCRLWVTAGQKCRLKDIPQRVLAQLNLDDDQMSGDDLKKRLKGRRYLIVLDDVWDKYMAYYLQSAYHYGVNKDNSFPSEDNGSRILITTRLQQGDEDCQFPDDVITMRLLDEDESWNLLREKVFRGDPCPFRLEEAGKKIAKNCDGLPLTIVTVADLLSDEEKTPEYWHEVATRKNHQLFMTAYEEISKVLLPSYNFLPQLLQKCFLHLGIFPPKFKVPRSKIINMWSIDGFLEENARIFPYPRAIECLEELVSNSLVMIYDKTIDIDWGKKTVIKTCGLQSSLWHMCNKEARKIKFCHVLNLLNDCLGEDIEGQHRLSFHNNVLFGIKDVHELVEYNCASTAHSLFCYGPYHQYQVPLCFTLKLLREVDAITIRFYEFPMEVLDLVRLKYLALTLDSVLPASISNLSSLEFLIVCRHASIKSRRGPSELPEEIWSMKKLQHLQVMGNDLPYTCGALLESLSTLSNVSARSCRESVFKATPNLKKLGIQIELSPDDDDDDGKLLRCFDHIYHLKKLKSLKCVVVNPKVVPPVASLSIIPEYLGKLSLSGMCYSWKEMSKIASLPCLTMLKLRNYAFRGPKWDVEEGEGNFCVLGSLLLEDTDLVEWKIGFRSFPRLCFLSIKHCYKLGKIDGNFGMSLENMELVDCSPLCVKEMEKAVSEETEVVVVNSWEEKKRFS